MAYALVSGSDRKFEVDVSTGLVTTVDYLDYETKTSYLMNVSATDQSAPFHRGYCTVYVTLLNELDEAVAFFLSGYETTLRENIATGTEVIQVQAQSADNLNQLTYRFDPDTSPAALALFKIDSVTVGQGRGHSVTQKTPDAHIHTEKHNHADTLTRTKTYKHKQNTLTQTALQTHTIRTHTKTNTICKLAHRKYFSALSQSSLS